MPKSVIEAFVWLSNQAYEVDEGQSLLGSLRDIRPDDWTALLPGAGRSIADILEHVGWAKWMYEDYAFGPGNLRGDQPPQVPPAGMRTRPHEELLQWLEKGHRRWLGSVAALSDDSELERPRLTNWGDLLPTRALIQILVGHDFYHAGEINHIRALLQGTDRWPY